MTPSNDHVVGSRSSPTDFAGYLFTPNVDVDLYARKPVGGSWAQLSANGTSSSTPSAAVFGTSLYEWSIPHAVVPNTHWQAGAVGYRTEVQGRQASDASVLTTFDTSSTQTMSCLGMSQDWPDFQAQCASHDNGVLTLTTSNFVPDVTVGRTGCTHTTNVACSPCVNSLALELFKPNIDIEYPDAGYRLYGSPMFATGAGSHTQGVARLRDLIVAYNSGGTQDRVGRVVHTDNAFDSGSTYYEQPVTTGYGGIYDTIYYSGDDPARVYRQNLRVDFGHPGGAQAHGDLVVVAMENRNDGTASDPLATSFNDVSTYLPANAHAAVYFLHYAPTVGAVGEIANVLPLNGNQGEPLQSPAGTGAAGFVQLADGHFLVAVQGGGGFWFYYSDRDSISLETEWRFISRWTPPCTTGDGSNLECYGGANGVSLLTDCSGAIYLIAKNGTDRNYFGPEYQWIQVYRIDQDTAGDVELWLSSAQIDYTGTIQTNNPAFRWAGGAYVSALQLPVLFNAERGTNEGNNNAIDGHLFYRLGTALRSEPIPGHRPPLSDPDSRPNERVPKDMVDAYLAPDEVAP